MILKTQEGICYKLPEGAIPQTIYKFSGQLQELGKGLGNHRRSVPNCHSSCKQHPVARWVPTERNPMAFV